VKRSRNPDRSAVLKVTLLESGRAPRSPRFGIPFPASCAAPRGLSLGQSLSQIPGAPLGASGTGRGRGLVRTVSGNHPPVPSIFD